MVNVPPRAAFSYSNQGATAASLDYYSEDEEDGSFHQFHAHRGQLGSPRKEREAPRIRWCTIPLFASNKIDPLWQTTWWLRSFEQCEEDEPIWWPLVHPLTDESDTAMLALAWQLMAVWRWAITISTPPVYPPAPTVMNIGQFLYEDTLGADGVYNNGWRLTLVHSSALRKLQKAGAGDLRVKALPPRSLCWWRLSSE